MLRTWKAHEDACISFADAASGVELELEQRPQAGAATRRTADGTNLKVWPATLTFGRWLCARPAEVRGRTVVELGAGSGAAGMICAALGATQVWITDVPDALPLVEDNISRNQLQTVCRAHQCTWGSAQDVRALRHAAGTRAFDVIIASELLYKQAPETFDALLWTMRQLSHARTKVYVCYEFRGELFDDMHFFTSALESFDVDTISLSSAVPESVASAEQAHDPADEWLYIYTPRPEALDDSCEASAPAVADADGEPDEA